MTPRRGSLWPLVLIVAGLLFLAGNLGYLSVRPAAVIGLWPLLLILLGVDIAFARRWPVPAIVAQLVLIAGGVALVLAQPSLPTWQVGASAGATSVSEPRDGAQALTLHVSGGAGTYTIRGGASELVEASADQPRLAVRRSARSGGAADVRLDQTDGAFRFGSAQPITVDVRLAGDVPATLDVSAGAGDLTIDLTDVRLRDARINVGAAALVIVLPHAKGDVPITVAAGASSVTIQAPPDVEARVTASGALTSLRDDTGRFAGDATPGYASAADRVTVRITGGASSVVIR